MKITFFIHLLLLIMMFVVPVKAQQTSLCKKTITWDYGGYTFTDDFELSLDEYNYYKSKSKRQPYEVFATEEQGHEYFLYLAKVLYKDAKDLKYNDYQLTAYLTAFVQSIPYKDDPYNGGYDYPKYPIETIVEGGGDCEDKAALLAALLKTFSIGVVMVELTDHMAVGVACEDCGDYYTYKGRKYSFIETTSKGWKVGESPYSEADAHILEIAQGEVFNRDDTYVSNTDSTNNPQLPNISSITDSPFYMEHKVAIWCVIIFLLIFIFM